MDTYLHGPPRVGPRPLALPPCSARPLNPPRAPPPPHRLLRPSLDRSAHPSPPRRLLRPSLGRAACPALSVRVGGGGPLLPGRCQDSRESRAPTPARGRE